MSKSNLRSIKGGAKPMRKGFTDAVAIAQEFQRINQASQQQAQQLNMILGQLSQEVSSIKAASAMLDIKLSAIKTLTNINEEDLKREVEAETTRREIEAEKINDIQLQVRPVDRPLKLEDTCEVSFVGRIEAEVEKDGKKVVEMVPFPGGTTKTPLKNVKLTGKTLLFDDELVGMKSGETRTVKSTFPLDYHQKELVGKNAEFDVTIHNIKEPIPAPKEVPVAEEVVLDCEKGEDCCKNGGEKEDCKCK